MDDGSVENRYRSRKFLITISGVAVAALFAYLGKLTPDLSNVILAAIASYNMANAWLGK